MTRPHEDRHTQEQGQTVGVSRDSGSPRGGDSHTAGHQCQKRRTDAKPPVPGQRCIRIIRVCQQPPRDTRQNCKCSTGNHKPERIGTIVRYAPLSIDADQLDDSSPRQKADGKVEQQRMESSDEIGNGRGVKGQRGIPSVSIPIQDGRNPVRRVNDSVLKQGIALNGVKERSPIRYFHQ